jgi:hypothetical protein
VAENEFTRLGILIVSIQAQLAEPVINSGLFVAEFTNVI